MGGFSFSEFARPQATRCAASPCHGRLRAESADMLRAARNPLEPTMIAEQLKLLARMIRDGQAKIAESGGKLVPVSLI
jgi:hypothetical protein